MTVNLPSLTSPGLSSYLGRNQETRRRKYLNRTIRGGFRAAQHYLNTRLEELDRGRELDSVELTLNQYLDRWLELAVQPKLRSKSASDYQALLGRYIRPALGERELGSLAPLDFQRVYHQMYQRGLATRTVHYSHAVLDAALKQAVRWQLLTSNPAGGVEIPKPTRREMQVLKAEKARRFLEHVAKTKYGVLFALALTTGMRPSEYLALR